MSVDVVFIAGSPSPTSRSSQVARAVTSHAERAGLTVRAYSLHDFDASDVLFGRADAPAIKAFVDVAKGAGAIVVASPVYKATYAGGLKAIVDLIPHDALVERAALGIATTRLPAHAPEVEHAYRALFGFFSARTLAPLVVLDEELHLESAETTFAPAAKERIDAAARALVEAVVAR